MITAPIGLLDHKVVVCINPHHRTIDINIELYSTGGAQRVHHLVATNHMTGPTLQLRFEPSHGKHFSVSQPAMINCTIRTLLDLHLPESQIRHCSRDKILYNQCINAKSTTKEGRWNGDTMSEKFRLLRKITQNDGGITSKLSMVVR